jgi:hypothetical protein
LGIENPEKKFSERNTPWLANARVDARARAGITAAVSNQRKLKAVNERR